MNKSTEKKNIVKFKILNYMLNQGETSKAELAKQLELRDRKSVV